MSFNPLEEKGMPLEKQMRSWHEITLHPFNKNEIDCYSRTRQILMNGIELESWYFKHNYAKSRDLVIADDMLKDKEAKLLEKGLQKKCLAPDTVTVEELKEMMKEEEIEHECK